MHTCEIFHKDIFQPGFVALSNYKLSDSYEVMRYERDNLIKTQKNEIKALFPDEELQILESVAVKEEGVTEIFDAAMQYYTSIF